MQKDASAEEMLWCNMWRVVTPGKQGKKLGLELKILAVYIGCSDLELINAIDV